MRAITKRWSATITLDDMRQVYARQKGRCALSGRSLRTVTAIRNDPEGLSVDRIDNQLGYDAGNIRLVTARVNYAIGSRGSAEFVQLCRDVVKFQGET